MLRRCARGVVRWRANGSKSLRKLRTEAFPTNGSGHAFMLASVATAAAAVSVGALTSSLYHMDAATTDEAPAAGSAASSSWSPSFIQQRVGNYENRLREMSAPEKVFDYFASVEGSDGTKYMTPLDFTRSITPYMPAPTALVGAGMASFGRRAVEVTRSFDVPAVFAMVDVDGDGLISFSEYLLFTTLLSVPKRYFRIAFQLFDDNGDRTLDSAEFTRFMHIMTAHNPVAMAGGSKGSINNNMPLPHLFGEKGKQSLSYDDFSGFINALHEGVLQMEFQALQGEPGQGYIDARAFATSMISYARMKRLPELQQRALTIDPGAARVTFGQYVAVQTMLEHMDQIDRYMGLLLSSPNAPFRVQDLQRVTKAVAGVDVDDTLLHLLVDLFDTDADGQLNHEEFFGVLRARTRRGLTKPRDFGLGRFVSCCSDCITSTV